MAGLEAVCIKILQNDCSLYIYAVYIQFRKVDDKLAEFYDAHLKAILELNSQINSKDTILICGDFNFGSKVDWLVNDMGFDYVPMCGDSLERKASIARKFTNEMLNNGLFQMSCFPNNAGNVLDLIYTNDPELVVVSKADFRMLPSHKSDVCHVPLMCMIEVSPNISNNDDIERQLYSFRKANYEDIRQHLSAIDFQSLLNNYSNDVDRTVETFYEILNDTIEKFVPKSKIRSTSRPIWHDKILSSLKNRRNKDYNKLCADRLRCRTVNALPFLQSQQKYEEYRADLHEKFIQEQAVILKRNPKKFWKYLNSKRKCNYLPDIMTLDGKTASSDTEKADLFADFFESVYVKHEEDKSLDSFIRQRNDANCINITISDSHVKVVLSRMNVNKGCGFDGIASILLRECSNQLSLPLSMIFASSLSQRHYPNAFKIGLLTPIYKSGSKKDMRNYRGVNTVPNIAKVFDKVVNEQIKLIVQPQVKTTQHGFLPYRNIETNLMELTTHIHHAFATGSQLDVFISDLSKAFDHVDSDLEVRKLADCPFSNDMLFWFKSYFTGRCQYVKVGEALSRLLEVSSGVGQGSINGPTFFTSFFNDSDPELESIIPLNFADDKKLAQLVKCDSDITHPQDGINEFMDWCEKNKLSVNIGKCKVITFSRKKHPTIHEYVINGVPIVRVYEVIDLGIILDVKLIFLPHIEYVINRAIAILRFVKRQSQFFGSETIKILYQALVRSILEFSSIIWSPHFSIHKERLESVQKQLVLFLLGDHNRHLTEDYVLSPYTDRCAKLVLATLVRRRINAAVLFIHSLITGKLQSPLLRSLLVTSNSLRFTRYADLFTMETYNREYLRLSPFNKAIFLFNVAARHVDPLLPRAQFRTALLSLPDHLFGDWAKI